MHDENSLFVEKKKKKHFFPKIALRERMKSYELSAKK